jgi:hypothetical protein
VLYEKTNFSRDGIYIRSCRYIQSQKPICHIYKESLSDVYGSNKLNKVKEKLKANKILALVTINKSCLL